MCRENDKEFNREVIKSLLFVSLEEPSKQQFMKCVKLWGVYKGFQMHIGSTSCQDNIAELSLIPPICHHLCDGFFALPYKVLGRF